MASHEDEDELLEKRLDFESLSWLDPGTWFTGSRSAPALIGIVALGLGLYAAKMKSSSALDMSNFETCAATFEHDIPINMLFSQASHSSTQSWEISALFEAKLEMHSPDSSVFGRMPFPDGRPPALDTGMSEAFQYVTPYIQTKGDLLHDGESTLAGSASLGVAALMLGQSHKSYLQAAKRRRDTLLSAPRLDNGAISEHRDKLEISPKAVSRFAPFLAYYGIVNDDLGDLALAAQQFNLYQDLLTTKTGSQKGLWQHAKGPETSDSSLWLADNAIASFAMAQVRSSIAAWPKSNSTMSASVAALDEHIHQIITAAVASNKITDGAKDNMQTSGSVLLAAVIYRMAMARPEKFSLPELLIWAHETRRRAFATTREHDSFGQFATYGLEAGQQTNKNAESPTHVLLLAAAWRDCVCRGHCLDTYLHETDTEIAAPAPLFERLTGQSFAEHEIGKYLTPLLSKIGFDSTLAE